MSLIFYFAGLPVIWLAVIILVDSIVNAFDKSPAPKPKRFARPQSGTPKVRAGVRSNVYLMHSPH